MESAAEYSIEDACARIEEAKIRILDQKKWIARLSQDQQARGAALMVLRDYERVVAICESELLSILRDKARAQEGQALP